MKQRVLKLCWVTALLSLLLCGCKDFGEYSDPNDRRLVSVIGFDDRNGDIKATTEVIEATEDGGTVPYILTQNGKSVREALSKLYAESPKELSFTHCSAIVLGEELSAAQINDILDYCTEDKSIPLSTKVLSANNAEDIISLGEGTAVSAGFAMADMTENTANRFGYGGHAALYEIKTARMQTANVYALPFFEEKGEKPCLGGMCVYINDENVALLDGDECISYAVIRNIYDGGEVFYDGNVFDLDSASSKVKIRFENGQLTVDISVFTNPKSKALAQIIQNTAESFDTDIFGIANTIEARYPEVFDKIKTDYGSYYKNAEIVVREE